MSATSSLAFVWSVVAALTFFQAGQVEARTRPGRGITYIDKNHKVACIAEHLKETDHYLCDKYGYVHCMPGWSDPRQMCTTPVCVPKCSENGNCTRPNTCTCEIGWAGADCSKCICLPGCVNGDCRLPFDCICEEGWKGMLCNKAVCKEGCAHGTCSMPGECICQPGWSGPNCDVCETLPGCNKEHGYCNKPMECTCEEGWTGQFCSEPICRLGCHKDYGWCRKPTECWCRPGWTGPTCETCMKYPGCQNGSCNGPWECNCSPGYTGMLCNAKVVVGINPPSFNESISAPNVTEIPQQEIPQEIQEGDTVSTTKKPFGFEFDHKLVQGPAQQLLHTNENEGGGEMGGGDNPNVDVDTDLGVDVNDEFQDFFDIFSDNPVKR